MEFFLTQSTPMEEYLDKGFWTEEGESSKNDERFVTEDKVKEVESEKVLSEG